MATATHDEVRKSTDRFDVVGIGALNVDLLLRVASLDCVDTELVALEEATSAGGSAANTIFALSRLGVVSSFIGAVGDDKVGEMLVSDLKSVGVATDWVLEIPDAVTGEAICVADQKSQRLIVIRDGANARLDEAAMLTIVPRLRMPARCMHLASFVGDAQLALQVEIVRQATPDTLISFSPGRLYVERGLEQLGPILARTDILFVNRTEIAALMGMDYEYCVEAAQTFLQRFRRCRTVVVTLGAGDSTLGRRGYTIERVPASWNGQPGIGNDSGQFGRLSCVVVERDADLFGIQFAVFERAIDATGAGDAFAAGYLYGVLNGQETQRCALLGHTTAQFSVLGLGARGLLPNRDDLENAAAMGSGLIVRISSGRKI